MTQKLFLLGLASISFFSTVVVTFAAENPLNTVIPCYGGSSACGDEVQALPTPDFRDQFLPIVTRFLLYGMATVAFIMFFVAGVMLVTASGDQERTKKAKNIILWGIVGMTFAGGAYALVRGVLGLDFG